VRVRVAGNTPGLPLPIPNENWELIECMEIVYEILADLEDIKSTLEEGKNPSHIFFPLFDPFRTIGKYC
jgi:hypothetical protein